MLHTQKMGGGGAAGRGIGVMERRGGAVASVGHNTLIIKSIGRYRGKKDGIRVGASGPNVVSSCSVSWEKGRKGDPSS
jgi:hypothetical protein